MHTLPPAARAFVTSPEYLIPPSAMIGIPYSFATAVAVHNSGYLRNTDTCNDTCGTDRSGSDTYLDSVNAGLDQGSCSLTGATLPAIT